MSESQAYWPPEAMQPPADDPYVCPRAPEYDEQLHSYTYPCLSQQSLILDDEAAAHPNPSPTLQQRPQQFDPRALLNPRSVSKRPAAEQESERGRESELGHELPGQVSLVERLHNVHERTASPAKKIKTDDDRTKKTHSPANFGAGALNMKKQTNGQDTQPPQSNLAIDLTMSKIPPTTEPVTKLINSQATTRTPKFRSFRTIPTN